MSSALETPPRVEAAAERVVVQRPSAHPLVDKAPAIVRVRGLAIGGPRPVLASTGGIVADASGAMEAAQAAAQSGVQLLLAGGKGTERGGSAAGLRRQLELFREAAGRHGLALAAPVQEAADGSATAGLADLLVVPGALMQSFAVLRAAGASGLPVLLGRGLSASVEEWLLAAEYLLLEGAAGVVLCEGGIRSFDHPERPMLDLGAVAFLKQFHRLPVLVAPCRAAGWPELIEPLARAALAAGADGLLLEPTWREG